MYATVLPVAQVQAADRADVWIHPSFGGQPAGAHTSIAYQTTLHLSHPHDIASCDASAVVVAGIGEGA